MSVGGGSASAAAATAAAGGSGGSTAGPVLMGLPISQIIAAMASAATALTTPIRKGRRDGASATDASAAGGAGFSPLILLVGTSWPSCAAAFSTLSSLMRLVWV